MTATEPVAPAGATTTTDWQAVAAARLTIIRDVEWRGNICGSRSCPWCLRTASEGHAADCALAEILKETTP